MTKNRGGTAERDNPGPSLRARRDHRADDPRPTAHIMALTRGCVKEIEAGTCAAP